MREHFSKIPNKNSISSTTRMFLGDSHNCSYIDNRIATSLLIDPNLDVDEAMYHSLSARGFRRSGAYYYRPACENCTACIPIRIPVQDFLVKRSHRRVLERNADIKVERVNDIASDEIFDLYDRYIRNRHKKGGMYPPDREQYQSFLQHCGPKTNFYSYRLNNDLVAVSIIDKIENSLIAVYTFFDPKHSKRSLGSYSILWHINNAKRENYSYLYLGYWIKECNKMNYKINFMPVELRVNGQWRRINKDNLPFYLK